jgi:hypothetical protein
MFENVFAIVDGTECPIERPCDDNLQKNFYSGKKKKHTIKYEVAVRITDGQLVWRAGPGTFGIIRH